jgi:hypothetical protein
MNTDQTVSRIEDSQLDPAVNITLRNKQYTLEYNNFSIKGILKDTGFNLLNQNLTVKELGDPAILGAFLFWGLKTNHEELTQEQADKLLTYRDHFNVMLGIRKALTLYLPEVKGDEAQAPGEPENPPSPPSP